MDHSQPHNGTAVFSLTDVVLPTVKSFQADLSSQRFRNGFVEVPGFPVNRGQAALLCLCILMWIHTCLPPALRWELMDRPTSSLVPWQLAQGQAQAACRRSQKDASEWHLSGGERTWAWHGHPQDKRFSKLWHDLRTQKGNERRQTVS